MSENGIMEKDLVMEFLPSKECLNRRNGDHFEGNWVNDNREGQGSYFYAQKNKLFVGEYVDDMPKVGIYTEVKETDSPDDNAKDEKLREFDDIPPIPSLGLRDPIGVLERAFKKTRQKRILYRAKFMSLDLMFSIGELEQMKDIFKSELPQKGTEYVFIDQLPPMLEAIGIEVDSKVFSLSGLDQRVPLQTSGR